MTELIVLVPAILCWWVARKHSPEMAFLQVYLPVLLIFPDYYSLPIPSFPDPSMIQASILPLGGYLLWNAFLKKEWKFTATDLFVVAFLGWQVVCEVYNTGTEKMPDLVFDLITLAILPYMAAKMLIEPNGLRAAVGRRFVWCLFLVCVMSVYEFKMGVSLFRPTLGWFFPGQTSQWVTQIRWGFGRVAGPYGHAISNAVFIGVAFLLHRWLCRTGQWEEKFRFLGSHPFTKQRIIGGVLLAGILMTLSRGPWLGAIAGAIFVSVGLRPNRRRALTRAVLILGVGGGILYYGGKAYLAGASAFEGVEEQASAEYRAILVDQYEDIVMESPVFGWGRANWPLVQGMLSIDNNYLFVALGFGLTGLALFCLLFLVAVARIFRDAFFLEQMDPDDRMFRFTLFGILVSIAISTGTTYISAHMYPLFFVLLGWSEGCLTAKPQVAEARAMAAPAVAGYQMMRVIA